ncbi:DUF4345 domain-containing protein [Roseivirga misakiensis]|uniref:DUF4345 domain-containing protein n=1 Tax=Roseivirga misakiensis TaxID=1563681 RepID=A0A1E5T0F6_9BACT|nr:DUF4345 domain-containing protein [Roseivirga misakiensis]OEK04835.1 hypothetical protein BFP71_15455 [Roseivirga misakiensis]
MRKTATIKKNIHLIISLTIVVPFAFVYGLNPESILPNYFDFEVNNVDLKHFFRAIMGLYLAIATSWVFGIIKPSFWKSATIINLIFMFGLAFGRIVSLAFDGIPSQILIRAIALELILGFFALYQLRKYGKDQTLQYQ